MRDVKRGTITKIYLDQGIGVITENVTGTMWTFFLDELTRDRDFIYNIGTPVKFNWAQEFEQPTAEDVQIDRVRYSKAV